MAETIAFDSFNRADGLLTGDVADTGHPWLGETGSFNVFSNDLATDTGTVPRIAYLDTGKSNCRVLADMKDDSPHKRLAFRVANSTNGLLAYASSVGTVLSKMSAGTVTDLATAGTGTTAGVDAYSLRVDLVGSNVKVYVNDSLKINHTLSAGNQSEFGSNTGHGFYSSTSVSDSVIAGNFTVEVDAPTANAGPDRTVEPNANASLDGTVTWPAATGTTEWELESGPGPVTFTNAGNVDTTAKASTEGVYILSLTATDDAGVSASDTMVMTVNAKPVVDAGGPYQGVAGEPVLLDGVAFSHDTVEWTWTSP